MNFLSLAFAVFVALGWVVFALVPPTRRPAVLLALSYAFYLTWTPLHALWLLGLTLLVTFASATMSRQTVERRKFTIAVIVVAGLLGVLAAFKWTDAGRGNTSTTAGTWLIPLGLSYFTFKMLGYVLDLYWEKVPRRSFADLALYFSFFPQIVAGPIQRADDFFGQLDRGLVVDSTQAVAGLRRILLGLVKKVVLADRLTYLIADTWHRPSAASPAELIVVIYCFALQLYMDFSGITDIAIGVGQLFGLKGPENFSLPFWAPNIQEFWRRWHISLTSWLTDYLFLPLRMLLRNWGSAGLIGSIFATMIAIGLWHGFTATFLVFGALNGLFMTVSVLTLKSRDRWFKAHSALRRARAVAGAFITFSLIAFALIFFRAPSFAAALDYLRHIAPVSGLTSHSWLRLEFPYTVFSLRAIVGTLCLIAAVDLGTWCSRQLVWQARAQTWPRAWRWAAYYAATIAVLLSASLAQKPLYAHF